MKPWMASGLGLLALAGLAAPARSQSGYASSYPVSYYPFMAGVPVPYYSYPPMAGQRAAFCYYVVPQTSAPGGHGWPANGTGMPAMANGVEPASVAPPRQVVWPAGSQPSGVYSSGQMASAQFAEIPPRQPDIASPPTVILPSTTNTGSVSPTCCDPISRVPNFLGDFVARPSFGFVNQPITSTVITNTLTFFGLPSDVAGGIGANTFFAPFRPNGFVGPGGPYRIFTDVTGTNVPFPPDISILNENAQLTAAIQANFPGATFAGGLGLLEPPFPVIFQYLQTTGQTVPGLVALVSLPNPSGGGLVGRNKYFDDGSPLPRDRVFFDYSHVGNFQGLDTSFDVNRYVFGAEKTFLDGTASVEVRVPFAGTVNSDQLGGQALDVDHAEFGNVGLLLKGTLFRNANGIVAVGLGLSMPTADDSRILFAGRTVLEIRNHAWLLQPILAAAWVPNDRFYVQAGLQFDFDANGNPVYVRPG